MNPPSSDLPPSRARTSRLGFLPWILAAGLAVTSVALWQERGQLSAEANALRREALAQRTQDPLAKLQLATLTAPEEAEAKGSAVVVWDAERQRGIIQLAKMPRAGAGQDYQLWLSDPRHPAPVSAGVVPVGADGLARVSFTSARSVRVVEKCALSIVPAGGVEVAAGPVVLRSH